MIISSHGRCLHGRPVRPWRSSARSPGVPVRGRGRAGRATSGRGPGPARSEHADLAGALDAPDPSVTCRGVPPGLVSMSCPSSTAIESHQDSDERRDPGSGNGHARRSPRFLRPSPGGNRRHGTTVTCRVGVVRGMGGKRPAGPTRGADIPHRHPTLGGNHGHAGAAHATGQRPGPRTPGRPHEDRGGPRPGRPFAQAPSAPRDELHPDHPAQRAPRLDDPRPTGRQRPGQVVVR